MSKRRNLILVVALAFAALLSIPFAVNAVHAQTPTHASVTTTDYAFTALITKGEGRATEMTGGLTLDTSKAGDFTGSYRLSDDSTQQVVGAVKSDGSITFTFYKQNVAYLKGRGKENNSQQFSGDFGLFQAGKLVSTGAWSTLAVDPKSMTALALDGTVNKGHDKGTLLAGAIILNNQTLTGAILDASGNTMPCQIITSNGGKNIQLTVNKTTIIGTGKLVTNPGNKNNKGYSGVFAGPNTGDKGNWKAFFFKL